MSEIGNAIEKELISAKAERESDEEMIKYQAEEFAKKMKSGLGDEIKELLTEVSNEQEKEQPQEVTENRKKITSLWGRLVKTLGK